MKPIEEVIRETNEKNQDKVNWTKAWSGKYPILKTYQKEVNIDTYAKPLQEMLQQLENEHHYSKQDAMLVLKDILYHVWKDQK